MPVQAHLILVLTITLPICWFFSEFQDRRWIRLLLGILSISLSFLIASVIGQLQQMNYNASYGHATAQLLDTTIAEIEEKRTDRLLETLRQLRDEFLPTYESRANYDQLVDRFTAQLSTAPPEKVGEESSSASNTSPGE